MITIKDVARQLKLSSSTVSRALNDHPAISAETKKRVMEYAHAHNYTPNRNARNLVNRGSHTIGFMIPDISDSFFSHSAFGVEDVLYKSGHEIFYGSTERNPKRVRDFLIRAQEYRFSGVFLTPDSWDDSLIELVHKIGIPVVSLRRKTPRTAPEIPFVDSDHYGGCKQATEYLISQGHRDIGMIAAETIIENERLSGYEDTVMRNGLRPHVERSAHTASSSMRCEAGFNAARTLLERDPEITAVLTSDDMLAIGVMEYLASVKRRVPDDMSVIGCDDRPEGRLFPIQLTTVHQALNELGRQAAEMMLRMIAEGTRQAASIVIQTDLIVRKTTGPRRGD